MIPTPWEAILLALAAYRIWRLIAEDDITERPRNWVLNLGDWEPGDPTPKGYREKWGLFLTCPWCAGFWISVLWWLAFLVYDYGTLIAATPFAISAAVGFMRRGLDPPEE